MFKFSTAKLRGIKRVVLPPYCLTFLKSFGVIPHPALPAGEGCFKTFVMLLFFPLFRGLFPSALH
nr:MAG TPA: hypothetical protein [Caudoviricetes sp.]